MKIELFTNVMIVDAIRFVGLHAAPMEKVSSDKTTTDEKNSNHENHRSIATTSSTFL